MTEKNCDLCATKTSDYLLTDGVPSIGAAYGHTNVCRRCTNPETPRALAEQLHARAAKEQAALRQDFGNDPLTTLNQVEDLLERWYVVADLLSTATSADMLARAFANQVPLEDRPPVRPLPIRDWLPEALVDGEPELGQIDLFAEVTA